MRYLTRFILSFFTASLFTAFGYSAIEKDDLLERLKKDHPRLIITKERITELKNLIRNDEKAQNIYEKLKQDVDKIMDAEPVEYKIVGPRLLSQSRRCLDRVYKLALIYLLDDRVKYLDRARKELYAAADFPDWNPSHFLDTAEMTHAFAIGYDWLYDDLSVTDRKTFRVAMKTKGLRPFLDGLEDEAWWSKSQHNWNQVCYGGISIGALALMDEAEDMTVPIIQNAVDNIKLALQHYAPDGGWNEGPGYWHYATRYTVYFFSALNTALGTDFELSEMEGLDNTGLFRLHFTGPTGQTFNYADAGSRAGGAEELYWLAERYDLPVLAWEERQYINRANALDLVWYSSKGKGPAQEDIPLDALFKGVNVAFFRSAWNDPNALFVGFKGGDNKANHSHLDLGSFVLDAEGKRWVVDLGPDNYNLPGYFGDKRWSYFRLNTQSHNTLVINEENQDPKAEAPITHYDSNKDWTYAIADLTEAYKPNVEKVERGVGIAQRKHVVVQDEVHAEEPVDVKWQIVTPAEIEIQEQTCILSIDDKRLKIQILNPKDAHFSVESANPPEPQRQQPEMSKLVITLPEKVENYNLFTVFTPFKEGEEPEPYVRAAGPLKYWK